MVGIIEIGGVQESAAAKPAVERKKASSVNDTSVHDEINLSSDAAELSALAGKIQESSEQSEAEVQRMADIRNAIESGTYKVQEAVLQVAARIAKYVSPDGQNIKTETAAS
jgi:anti-sigma28 factor (negative regulator of flagellin synthesis)